MKHRAGVPQAISCSVTKIQPQKQLPPFIKLAFFRKYAIKLRFLFGENDDYRKNVKKYLKKYFESCILSTWNSSTHCGTLKIGKYGTVPYSEKSLHQIRGSSHDTQGNGAR